LTANVQAANFRSAPAGECNYMYVDSRNNLLYYGTSTQCQTRLSGHNPSITSANGVVLAFDTAMANEAIPAGSRQRVIGILGQVATLPPAAGIDDEVDAANLRGDQLPPLTSDTCIGINSALNPIAIWTLDFGDGDGIASRTEQCVLRLIRGNCNRTRRGSPRASAQAVMNAIEACAPADLEDE
jgi:hypothetical protein